jgi:protein-disulfide isomerase
MAKNTPKLPDLPADDGSSDGAPSRAQVKAERRAAAQAEARERQRKEKARRTVIQVVVGVVAAVLVIGGAVFFLTRSGGDADTTPPANLSADGSVTFGSDDAPVTIELIEDFQCPICKNFEQEAGDTIAKYRADDQVQVQYHPIAFLDRQSSTEYSSRALNASACVLDDAGADAWLEFHTAAYADQPEEGGEGLPNSDLVTMAEDAGASDAVKSCIDDRTYDGWVEKTTQDTLDQPYFGGTPTVLVNGEVVKSDSASIEAAVTAALGS